MTYAINTVYPANCSKVESDGSNINGRDYLVIFFAADDLFSKIPTSVMVVIDNLHSSNILLREYYCRKVMILAEPKRRSGRGSLN